MNFILFRRLDEKFGLKLFVLFAFFVLIVSSSFTAMFIHFEGKSLNKALIRDNKLLAGILAQNTRIGVFSENEVLLNDPVNSIFQKEDILDISIYNQDGILIKNKIRDGIDPTKDEKQKIDDILKGIKESKSAVNYEDREGFKFWAPVLSKYDDSLQDTAFSEEPAFQENSTLIGYVKLTVGKEELNRQLNNLLIRSIIISLIFFIAGSVIIYSVMKRLTKPLDRLTVAVKTVGAGEVAEKVNVETKDEIGKLANAFNNMVDSIKWREQALKESELKYRTLFEESRDVIFIIDNHGKFIDANQAAFELFGYSRDEILAIGLDDLFHESEEFKDIKKYVGSNHYVRDKEVKLKNRAGTPIDCLLTLSMRKSDGNIMLGYQGIIRDVTHQKVLEAQLLQAQKMESIGTLAGGIAHDFNNILSPIMLHCEMAMDDLGPDNPLQLSMKEIFKAAGRARDLVKQILTFARKRAEEKIVVKASLIVKEVVKFMRSTIPTTIDLQYFNNAQQDMVLADPTQINRIVMNLCTNAAYAMKEKGGILEVILENEDISDEKANVFFVLKPGRYLKLTVRDNGTGIPPDIIDRIFEPYFTTKKTGEGTGLGLATIHGIIKDYGGYLSLESEVGKGTIFYVYLPIIIAEDTDRDERQIFISRGTERILFVDDEKSAIDSMQKTLERLGYKVSVRTSSVEALEAFRNDPSGFDLVITDMTMPNMTGKELASELKNIRPDLPIILCTGFSDQIDKNKAKELGIDAFLMKPIIRSKIANTIRAVLDKKPYS